MEESHLNLENRIKPQIHNAELKPLSTSSFIDQEYPDKSVQLFYQFILNRLKYWSYDNLQNVTFGLEQFHQLLDQNQENNRPQSTKIQSEVYKDIDTVDSLKLLYNQTIKPDEVILIQQQNNQNVSINDVEAPQQELQQNFIPENNQRNAQDRRRNLVVQEAFTSLNCNQYCDIIARQEFQQLNPYNQLLTWRIRSCVFTGLKQLKDIICEECECISTLIKSSFRRIVTVETLKHFCKKTDQFDYERRLKDPEFFNIVYGIRTMISIPFYFAYTLIGFPLYHISSYDNYGQRQVHQDDAQKKEKFQKQVEERVNQNRDKFIDKRFFQILNQEDQQIFSQNDFIKLDEQKFIQYINQVKGVIKFQPTEQCYKQQLFRLEQFYMGEIEKQLKSMGYGEDVCNSFKNNYLSYVILNYYQEILQQLNHETKQCLIELIEEFSQNGLANQCELLKIILEEYQNVYDSDQQVGNNQSHQQVTRIEKIPAETISFDYLIIDQQFSISTNFFFWKIIWFFLFILQVLFFIIYHGFDQALNGFFGLKVVFLSQFGRHSTIRQLFISITQSVQDSINAFENEPNEGILDKCITRICHRVYNYGFKYLFCGVILVSIFMRLLFVFLSLILIILTPIAALTSPLIAFLVYLFTVFIYDFLSPNRNNSWNIPIILPIPNLIIFRFLIMSLGKILLCIFMFIGYYLLSLVLVFLTALYVGFRLAFNVPTFLILLLCGRIPISNTWAAQKIDEQNLNDIESIESIVRNNLSDQVEDNENIGNGSIEDIYNKHMNKIQRSISDKDYQKLSAGQIVLIVSSELKRILISLYDKDMIKFINQPCEDNKNEIKQCIPFVENPNLGKISQMYEEKTNSILDKYNQDMKDLEKKIPVYNKRTIVVYPFYYTSEEYDQIFRELKAFLISNNNLFSNIMWNDHKQRQIQENNFDHLTQYYLTHIFQGENKNDSNIKEHVMKSRQPINIENIFPAFCPNSSYNCKTKKFILFSDFIKEAIKVQKADLPIISVSNLSSVSLVNVININQ